MIRPIFFLFIILIIISCSNSSDESPTLDDNSAWLVDRLDVTGVFSLFPLSENPDFTQVSNIDIDDDELVGIVNFGTHVRVFPYRYSVQNEIINDTYVNQKYAFSYCPITKSALGFKREEILRASGYLYKDNMTPWDSKTETIWSQMLIRGIKGEMKGKRLVTIPVMETFWKTVKDYFPNALVLNGTPPLSNKSNLSKDDNPDDLDDNGTPPEFVERVYGIMDDFDNVAIFKYSDFASEKRIDKTIQGKNHIVIGYPSKRAINAFQVENFADFEVLDSEEFPLVLRHNTGIKYNILGVGTNGSVLQKPKYAYVAMWLAWNDIFENFSFQ